MPSDVGSYIWSKHKKPTDKLHDVLSGKVDLHHYGDAVASLARFYIYQGACEILSLDRIKRLQAINRVPESLREAMKNEVMRISQIRKP